MNLHSLRVADLKSELRKRGLRTTGRKQQLVTRLQEYITHYERNSQVKGNNKRKHIDQTSARSKKQKIDTRDSTKIKEVFNKYADDDHKIQMDGMFKLCEDLKVDSMNPIMIVLSWIMNAAHIGCYTESEFVTGMLALECENIDDLASKLPQCKRYLSVSDAKFASLYKFAFHWAREEGQRNVTKDVAVELWPMLINETEFPLLSKWCEFLSKKESVKVVTKDTWMQFLEFRQVVVAKGVENYDTENDAWPVLIDDFVDFVKQDK